MIAENVRKVFEDNLWFVSTCGDGPHVVPVGFKCVTEDGRFAIGALLLETTLAITAVTTLACRSSRSTVLITAALAILVLAALSATATDKLYAVGDNICCIYGSSFFIDVGARLDSALYRSLSALGQVSAAVFRLPVEHGNPDKICCRSAFLTVSGKWPVHSQCKCADRHLRICISDFRISHKPSDKYDFVHVLLLFTIKGAITLRPC